MIFLARWIGFTKGYHFEAAPTDVNFDFQWATFDRGRVMMDRRQFVGLGSLAAGAVATSHWSDVLAQAASAPRATPGATVDTQYGKIRGAQVGKVQAFRGVPYGGTTAPPHRFMPPRKPDKWTGVRDCFELGKRSPQLLSAFHGFVPPEVEVMDRDEPMSEDCLMLNVWTPSVGSGKRPVMVWLHGGGYTSGSGGFICYDGAELAGKHDVVVVTVNHRLNVFSYLYLAGLGGEKYANASNVGKSRHRRCARSGCAITPLHSVVTRAMSRCSASPAARARSAR